jgi:hypothetical protein
MLRLPGLVLLGLLIGGCAPEVGSKEWCEQIDGKPKGEWTANEASEYTKNCLF